MPFFRGGIFTFSFQISPIYPHEAPKVKCKTKVNKSLRFSVTLTTFLLTVECLEVVIINVNTLQIYHPNIDLEGNVCLNILREDWKPVLNINTVIYGLYHLFTVRLCLLVLMVMECPLYHWLNVCLCRSRIMRIPSIMMQLLCWGITPSCLSPTWEGQWLVGMWDRPSSLDAYRVWWWLCIMCSWSWYYWCFKIACKNIECRTIFPESICNTGIGVQISWILCYCEKALLCKLFCMLV